VSLTPYGWQRLRVDSHASSPVIEFCVICGFV
jgi:hypothetical protein